MCIALNQENSIQQDTLRREVPKFYQASESPGELFKTQPAQPHPQSF